MKGLCCVFNGYKQSNKVCFMYLECQKATRHVRLMNFQVKIPETGRKNIFRDKQQQKRYQ